MAEPSVRISSDPIEDNETPWFYVWLEHEPGDYLFLLSSDSNAKTAAIDAIVELGRLADAIAKLGGLRPQEHTDAATT